MNFGKKNKVLRNVKHGQKWDSGCKNCTLSSTFAFFYLRAAPYLLGSNFLISLSKSAWTCIVKSSDICYIRLFFNAAVFPIVWEKGNPEMARKLPKLTILFSFFHSHPLLSWGRGVNIQLFFCVWSRVLMQKVCIVFIGGRGSSQPEWRQHKSVWEITMYITFENGNYLFLHSALLPNLAASRSPRPTLLSILLDK